MVHGRADVPVALFKPEWKRFLPHKFTGGPQQAAAVGATAQEGQQGQQQQQQRPRPAVPLWRQLEEHIVHSLDGWRVYFRREREGGRGAIATTACPCC